MTVLAAMGQREPRGIPEPVGRPMHDLRHHRQGPDGARPTPGVSSNSGKSTGPRSAAAASVPCSRRVKTSLDRTS